MILFKKESYIYICGMIEDKYSVIVTDFLNLLTASFGIGKEEELIAYASTIEPAEA